MIGRLEQSVFLTLDSENPSTTSCSSGRSLSLSPLNDLFKIFGVEIQNRCQNLQLLIVWLLNIVFPRVNQGCCNTHFCRHMAECEVFLQPLDFEPIASRLYVQFQYVSSFLISSIHRVIYLNLPLCNSQQSYSPHEENKSQPACSRSEVRSVSLVTGHFQDAGSVSSSSWRRGPELGWSLKPCFFRSPPKSHPSHPSTT